MKNNSINCTQNESTIAKVKAIWDHETVVSFCDFCIKKVEDGHCPTTHLDRIGYANLMLSMKSATRRVYTRNHLKISGMH